MGKWLVAFWILVLFTAVIYSSMEEEEPADNRLSAQQNADFANFREKVGSLRPGDFVTFDEVNGGHTTYVVLDPPQIGFGDIRLNGPCPESNKNKMSVRILHCRNRELALKDFFRVTSIVKRDEEGWKDLAAWNALQ
jgi:hypothetical protein